MEDYNPFEWIERGRPASGSGHRPLGDALRILWRSPDKREVLPLLHSSNKHVVTDALFLLSELATIPSEILSEALRNASHPAWVARLYLANAALLCFKILTPQQIAQVLPLAGDPKLEVRCKIIELLSLLEPVQIETAIESRPELSEHKAIVKLLSNRQAPLNQLVASVRSSSRLEACYAAASILGRARRDLLQVREEDLGELTYESGEMGFVFAMVDKIQRGLR